MSVGIAEPNLWGIFDKSCSNSWEIAKDLCDVTSSTKFSFADFTFNTRSICLDLILLFTKCRIEAIVSKRIGGKVKCILDEGLARWMAFLSHVYLSLVYSFQH